MLSQTPLNAIRGTLGTNIIPKSTGSNTLGNSLFQDNGTETSIAVAPVSSVRFNIQGVGTTSATFGLKIHNSTGSNNAFIIRNDGFSSFGSLPVTSTRLNIQSSGITSATFSLKLDNNTPSPVLYARSDRRVAIGTSTFSGILTIDGNLQSSTDGVVIRNIDNGTGLIITGSSTTSGGISVNTIAAPNVTAASFLADIGGYGTLISSSGSLTGNVISDVTNIQRSSVTLNGFDVQGSILRLDDNVTGISGNIFTVAKNGSIVFQIDNTGSVLLRASSITSASLNIPSGTAPTSPISGDMWFDGTNVKFRVGGITKTFTLT